MIFEPSRLESGAGEADSRHHGTKRFETSRLSFRSREALALFVVEQGSTRKAVAAKRVQRIGPIAVISDAPSVPGASIELSIHLPVQDELRALQCLGLCYEPIPVDWTRRPSAGPKAPPFKPLLECMECVSKPADSTVMLKAGLHEPVVE